MHPDYRAVTIEQVLEHRGGFPHQFPPDISSDMWRAGTDPRERASAVSTLLGRAPAQRPGTFQYANTGYVTLGAVLEHISGKRWEEMIRQDLFGPIGMSSCRFGAPEGNVPRRGLYPTLN